MSKESMIINDDDVYVDGIDYITYRIEECSSLSRCSCFTMKYYVKNKHILHEDDWESYPCDCYASAYAFIPFKNGTYKNGGYGIVLCIQHLYLKNDNYFRELDSTGIIYYENIDKYVERYKILKDIL